MTAPVSRRQALGLLGVGVAAASVTPAVADTPEHQKRTRTLRFLHLPDTHIQPELRAPEGVAAALQHAANQHDKPEFMIVAGDIIMDSMAADVERTKVQWDVWNKVVRENWSAPVHYCLGDHDCWGLRKEASKATGDEPYYGKQMAFDMLGIDRAYYSFDQGGWHFIVLDGMHLPDDATYEGKIDEVQWAWLEEDLASTDAKTPTVIHTHIPILSGAVMIPRGGRRPSSRPKPVAVAGDHKSPRPKKTRFRLPEGVRGTYVAPSRMHLDFARFNELFGKYANVKLCLSGHLHVRERLEYNGVTYVCNGAVCGNNWRGDRDQTRPGYGLVDLFDDGTFEESYVNFPWTWDESVTSARG